MVLVFKDLEVEGFEKVVEVKDSTCGLHAIIAIHNTTLGPALGGTRFYPYKQFSDALFDVTRLAKGMTDKAAISEVGLGGAKSVVIVTPENKTPALLRSLAQAVDSLEGLYTCAPDYGCTVEDIDVIHSETKYVVGGVYEHGSGDPGPFTAWGTLRGMEATLKKLFGSESFDNKVVAIQGLGSVGFRIAEHLFWRGAKLIVADPCLDKVQQAQQRFGAQVVALEDILKVQCDILAPCALGGIIHPQTIAAMNCKAVVGCANNQLLSDMDAKRLKDRDILYAPDFVVNAGGLINVSFEIDEKGYQAPDAKRKVDRIYDLLLQIYDVAEENDCSTLAAVRSMIDYRLKHGIGKRETPVCWHGVPAQMAGNVHE